MHVMKLQNCPILKNFFFVFCSVQYFLVWLGKLVSIYLMFILYIIIISIIIII